MSSWPHCWTLWEIRGTPEGCGVGCVHGSSRSHTASPKRWREKWPSLGNSAISPRSDRSQEAGDQTAAPQTHTHTHLYTLTHSDAGSSGGSTVVPRWGGGPLMATRALLPLPHDSACIFKGPTLWDGVRGDNLRLHRLFELQQTRRSVSQFAPSLAFVKWKCRSNLCDITEVEPMSYKAENQSERSNSSSLAIQPKLLSLP